MPKCSCPQECEFHRTGQYSFHVQISRVRSALGNDPEGVAAYLKECERMVGRGNWASQGLTVAEAGKIYHL